MPISEVQRKTGEFVGNSGSVTTTALDTATTAGNLVVITSATSAVITAPTGFTRPGPASATPGFFYKPTSGGETTFTFPSTSTTIYSYDVYEFAGVDPDFPVDVASIVVGTTNTDSSGSMPRSTTYDGKVIAVWHSNVSGSTTVPTFSGQTNGFDEQTDHGTTNGTNALALSTAWKDVASLAAYASTATVSAGTVNSIMVVLTAAGARREANIPYFWGFSDELSGYPACHGVSPAGSRYWEAQTGSPTIDVDGLLLAGTGSVQQISGPLVTTASPGAKAGLFRVRLRINSTSGDLELFVLTGGATAASVSVRYVTATSQIGLKIGTGTEQLSTQTATTGQWVDLDGRLNGTTTSFTCDWRVQVAGGGWQDQTQATFTSAATLGSFTPSLGWSAASIGNVSYAYAAYSITPGHYPLGDYAVVFLGPDTATTPTVLGSTANFRRFTANGTIDGAYDGPAIMTAVADWPPTFGASADGLACVAADTLGIRIPMATYDAASNGGSVRAVRVVAPLWAASTTAATIGVAAYEGSATTSLFTEADPNADTSATPPWVARLWRPTNGWTQAKLDAAEVRFISNDATPDIGPHAVGIEALVQVADTMALFGGAATAQRDPVTAGLLTVSATPTLGYDATLHYEEAGVPTDVAAPGGTTTTEVIDAPDAPSVNYVALYPPAEDISDA